MIYEKGIMGCSPPLDYVPVVAGFMSKGNIVYTQDERSVSGASI